MKSCLSDPLFRYVLGKVEKFPQVTFTESELRKISSDGFEGMRNDKLLKYQQSDPEQETFPCPTPCDKGCDRVIGNIRGSYRAICPEYSSVKPITLANSDLNRYMFNIEKLLSKIQKKNQLVESTYRVNDRIIFVGEKSIRQELVAVLLGLFRNGKEAESMLLGLSNQMRTYDKTIVLLPFLDRTSQSVLSRLESQKIIVARFEEAFPKSDLVIDFARLEKKRPKVAVEYPPLSPKQQRDKETHGYKCEDRLYLTGKEPKKNRNSIRFNYEKEIEVPNSETLLLVYLVMELKKGEGGWVHRKKLDEEGITGEKYPYRLISRLRNRLSSGLKDGDVERFIENDDHGRYRISTHPDFVIVKKRNWVPKEYSRLKVTVRKERERREFQKKRREEKERKSRF